MLAALGTVNTIHHLRAALLSRCGVHAALQRRIQYGGYHDSALAEWGGPAASTACSLLDSARGGGNYYDRACISKRQLQ
jgi:hypothetical protein